MLKEGREDIRLGLLVDLDIHRDKTTRTEYTETILDFIPFLLNKIRSTKYQFYLCYVIFVGPC